MFAIMRTGGKQYKVQIGDFVSVEKLCCEVGESVKISDVLMVEDKENILIGAQALANAAVVASVVKQKRLKTVLIFKKSRRKNYRRKNGHRQHMTVLKIESINC